MLTDAVLAVVLLAAPVVPANPPPGGAVGGPLAACRAWRAAHDAAGTVWQYACGGSELFRADVDDDSRRVDPDAFLRRWLSGPRIVDGATPKFTRERRRLGGREAETLRVVSGEAEDMIAAVITMPGGTRIVTCGPARIGACAGVADALASAPWREMAAGSIELPPPAVRLAERPVAIPEGCSPRTSPAGGGITCPGGVAVWHDVVDAAMAARAADESRAEIAATIGRRPEAAERVACRIVGVEGSCWRFVATIRASEEDPGAAGQRELFVWGWANAGVRPTFVACRAHGPEPVPRACAAVFELR